MSRPVAGLRTAFRPVSPGSRIAMSPWSRDVANPVALAILEARCVALRVGVGTVKRRDGSWMVRVHHDEYDRNAHLVGAGPLEAVIAGALDDYEAAHLFTAEELEQLQRQSA